MPIDITLKYNFETIPGTLLLYNTLLCSLVASSSSIRKLLVFSPGGSICLYNLDRVVSIHSCCCRICLLFPSRLLTRFYEPHPARERQSTLQSVFFVRILATTELASWQRSPFVWFTLSTVDPLSTTTITIARLLVAARYGPPAVENPILQGFPPTRNYSSPDKPAQQTCPVRHASKLQCCFSIKDPFDKGGSSVE
jgi:hypothetical protein